MSLYKKIRKWWDKEIIEEKREMAIKIFTKKEKDEYHYTSEEGYLLAILHKDKEGKWGWVGCIIEGCGDNFNTPIEVWDDMISCVYDK